MELFLVIMQIVALACVSALSIYLITILIRVREILTEVEHDFKELSSKAIPVFENLEVITDKIKNVTQSIDGQVEMVKNSIQSIKDIADNIMNFEKRIQDKIEEPVLDTVSVVTGLIKGIRIFFDRLRA